MPRSLGGAAGGKVGAREARLVYDPRCVGAVSDSAESESAASDSRWLLGERERAETDRKENIMRTPFTGVGTALVTPFTTTGALDEAGVSRLARRQIDEGVHFLVPCGTTGESPTLSEEERTRVVEICVEEARGKVPVLRRGGWI